VGYGLSLADIAVWGALNGNGIFKKSLKSGNQGHLTRWFQHLGSLPVFQSACAEFETAKANANKVFILQTISAYASDCQERPGFL
jgi:glutamyl-tRNA synthetase